MNFISLFTQFKEESISGRYLTNSHIEPVLENLKQDFEISVIGRSVGNKPIHAVKIGTGKTKIFMWSQMHGNESTTTKALFDLFKFLKSDFEEASDYKNAFTILCIPILNPDGAEAYTRVNANEVDLNRDSVDLSQPESQLLRKTFESFQPDFCYNLHDQRTIFAAGDTSNPATVSFLAPAYDEERNYNDSRLKAVSVIVAMNEELQKHIPDQVGRFDDSFNINCIGDMFQSLNVPTILFEAGHFQEDYQREETRKYIFTALMKSLQFINENDVVCKNINEYLRIPQNKIKFVDIVCKKFSFLVDSLKRITNFAIQYKEVLKNNKIEFEAFIVEVGEELNSIGHVEYDGDGGMYTDDSNSIPEVNKKADFYLNDKIKFVNGIINE
ncbi:M14 family metallopeptidase [Flavobacterium amniphilum]|uniref:M14 family metallopeptidase n=1 Tax=Flavobacterium amniphilum TaxID=1834035 RepID=UPI00202AA870|nr:M14 metallopeptidase family protein [Flavobacterium amniphilum]MCL9804267.1 M14 family metallopeptidase [Flavobacterium amniphilum]